MEEDELIKQRKEKLFSFLKQKYNLLIYLGLAVLVWFSIWLRTLNLSKLRDVTTNTWTLGPDLDPFLFMRWAKYIIENGSLFSIDIMRYSPFGYPTNSELLLHPYMMAWFHKIAVLFGSTSIEQSSVLYPVFMFALTVIAFFLLVRKLFINHLGELKAGVTALIACIFLIVIPSLLPRTIAGIPEKESVAFLFLFLAFYFFISAWHAKNIKSGSVWAILAGLSTAGMALIWGGYAFIFLTIVPVVGILFLFGQVDKKRFISYSIWFITAFIFMAPFSSRYSPKLLIANFNMGGAIFLFVIMIIHIIISKTSISKYLSEGKYSRVPLTVYSALIGVAIMAVIATLMFGFSFIPAQISFIIDNLGAHSTSRLLSTVAENKQPFFDELSSGFGPSIQGKPLFFWLFLVASVYLFYHLVRHFAFKEKTILTATFSFLLIGLIFSRYSSSGIFNGSSFQSNLLYGLSIFLFAGAVIYYVSLSFRAGDDKLKNLDLGLMLVLVYFFMCILGARGAIRLILMLVPPSAILVSYFIVSLYADADNSSSKNKKIILFIITAIVSLLAIYSAFYFYQVSKSTSESYAPSIYTIQWQKAMAWVRESTPENSVFAHWWDYGYWLQSIGNRATVLDGGNAISYWNHLMGRYALTGADQYESLEFFYAHNVTHFLIDSTDIGKYSAFSRIGSDKNYDRESYIPALIKDERYKQETKNGTRFFYPSGTTLDQDLVYDQNGTTIRLPAGKAGIAGILLELNSKGIPIRQPEAIIVYQNTQYTIPLRYAFIDDNLIDYDKGMDAGIFVFPRFDQTSEGNTFDRYGSLMYLGPRVVHSQLARLYLYGEQDSYFTLAHSEDDLLVQQLKQNQVTNSSFVYYQGVRGPISIWKISYPSNIKLNQEFLSREFPRDLDVI